MPQKKNWAKRLALIFVYFVGIYLAIMVFVCLAAPTFLSTEKGKNFLLEKIINQKIPAQLKIEKMSIGWFGTQSFDDVELYTNNGDLLLHIDNVETSTPLWKLLYYNGDLRQITIKNLNASIDETFIQFIHKLRKLEAPAPSILNDISNPVILSSVDVNMDFRSNSQVYQMQTEGFVNYKESVGSFSLTAEILPAKDKECEYLCGKNIRVLDGKLVDIPEVFIRRLWMLRSPQESTASPIPFIGNSINANISKENDSIHFTIETATTKGEMNLLLEQGVFKLAKPALLTIQADEAKNLKLDIKEFILPLSGDQPFQVDLHLNSDYIKTESFAIENLNASLTSTKEAPLFVVSANIDYLGNNSQVARYWGHNPKVNISTSIITEEFFRWQLPDFKMTVDNPKDQILIDGHIHARFSEVIQFGAVFNTILQPETLERWDLDFKTYSLLREPIKLKLSFSPSIIPLSGPFLNQILNSGEMRINKLNFAENRVHHIKYIEKFVLPWKIDGHKNKATLRCKGYLVYDDDTPTHKFRFHTNFYHWIKDGEFNLDHLAIDVGAVLPNIPIDLLKMFSGINELDKLFGNTINIYMKANIDPQNIKPGIIDIRCSSDLFKTRAKLSVGETIKLAEGEENISLKWTMNQSRFEALRSLLKAPENGLTIQEDAVLRLKMTDLSIPWKNVSSISEKLSRLSAKVDFSIQNLKLLDTKSGKGADYSLIEGKASTNALSELVAFSFKGDGASTPKNDKFSFSINGQFDRLLEKNDTLNFTGLSLTLDAALQKAPLPFLCKFFFPYHELHRQIDALLGNQIDGLVHLHLDRLQGSVDVNLKGGQGNVSFAGMLNNGTLTLYKPLLAEVTVTPKLGSSVLSYFNPLLSTAQSSSQPIKVVIDNGGFALPLHPWQPKEIFAPIISIEIGKLKFKNNGTLGQVLSVLNYTPGNNDDINVWILPIKADINKGKINVKRVDMLLADRFPIAIWGSANLPEDKLRMTIGLSPIALNNAFKVRGLPKGSMLQVPLRGSLENATIDTKQATAQVASLMAQAQGPQGVIIGSVIDILTGRGGDKKIPPPLTQLPWETDLPEDKSQSTLDKGGKFIEQQADRVIQKLFGK